MNRLSGKLPWLVLIVIALLANASPGAWAAPLAASGKSQPPSAAGPQDAWTRIQSTGRMVVGTAADCAPFEYRTPDFTIDGFDAELMRETARSLGVRVESRDYAFDGLLDGIQLGQLDGAIAAISVTDERSQEVNSSRVYHVGQDAVLAPPEHTRDEITIADNVAGKRVGIQRGSVYETEMQRDLVRHRPHQAREPGGLLTGPYKPAADHLDLVPTLLPPQQLQSAYEEAIRLGYLWHEFGDLNRVLQIGWAPNCPCPIRLQPRP